VPANVLAGSRANAPEHAGKDIVDEIDEVGLVVVAFGNSD
jgi:hypothetical protein